MSTITIITTPSGGHRWIAASAEEVAHFSRPGQGHKVEVYTIATPSDAARTEPSFDAMTWAQEELVAKYASMLKTDPVTLLDIAEALYHAEMGSTPADGTIRRAIRDYHYALDTRQNGGIAQHKAFEAICQALGMHWVQGQEKTIRDGGAQ